MDPATARSNRKPSPDFEIHLVGNDVRPWRVPMHALTRTLDAVQRLMEPASDESAEEAAKKGNGTPVSLTPLHLMQVRSGSATYAVSANDPEGTIRTLTDAGLALKDPSAQEWDIDILSPIEDLSAVARALKCSIEFKECGKKGAVFATIDGSSYSILAATAFVVGESSVYGYLERVGGATEQRCGLRIPNQPSKMIYCTVETAELVRKLGQHIYENILVYGTVTWVRKAWRVKTVRVRDFELSKTGSLIEALEEIYEAGGKVWDEIDDPEALIRELRGE